MAKFDSVEDLLKRYEQSTIEKELFKPMLERAYDLAIPQRNTFSNKTEGSRRMEEIYDSSPMNSVEAFRNTLNDKFTRASTIWSELQTGRGVPPELQDDFAEALETTTSTCFQFLDVSNFYGAVTESYADLASGTMALQLLPGDNDQNPFNFLSVPISEVFIEEGAFGKVSAVFRSHKLSKRIIKQTWPDANIDSISDSDLNEKYEVIEISYSDDVDSMGATLYDVILTHKKEKIVSREFKYNTWLTPRIGKLAGEPYGRGPLIQATPDMNMLNKMKELFLMNYQMSTLGIYTAADGGVANVDTLVLSPGMIIPVDRNGGPNGPSLAALPRAGDLNQQQQVMQEAREQIKQTMFDNRLPPDTGPVRSATEIMARMKQIRQTIGPFFGRLMFEFVQPLWQGMISILMEKNLLVIPKELSKVDNFFIKVNILSPIAKEQAFEDVENVVHAMQIMQGIGGEQAVALAYKIEEIGGWIGDKLGMPSTLIRSEEEREKLKQEAQQAQQAQLAQQGQQGQQGELETLENQ